jgi:hypothetical protein
MPFGAPAVGATGDAVCPSCGAPLGQGPRPDDTAAFQRFYTAPAPSSGGLRGLLSRLFGRR